MMQFFSQFLRGVAFFYSLQKWPYFEISAIDEIFILRELILAYMYVRFYFKSKSIKVLIFFSLHTFFRVIRNEKSPPYSQNSSFFSFFLTPSPYRFKITPHQNWCHVRNLTKFPAILMKIIIFMLTRRRQIGRRCYISPDVFRVNFTFSLNVSCVYVIKQYFVLYCLKA